jgi:hypothetical protein
MEAPYWQAIIHHNALKFIGFYVDSKELHPAKMTIAAYSACKTYDIGKRQAF